MNARLIGALLLACVTSFALPAFAGDDGPASSPQTGGVVKASHAGHNAQMTVPDKTRPGNHSGVGGVESGKSQSGKREQPDSIDPMYRGG
ncbi:hypothetical protein PTKU64_60170 [Paraburkholderia terrae]|uniref:DUF680 domain-containing protein n=2 Tax=Paraburkholderia terrae TaxID=311230 RepID=A0ABN6JN50_9BURK|nr:hypothetical protein PTKU64_60170 [Paraburkholderia terrae]